MFHGNKKKEKKPMTEEESKNLEDKLLKIKTITEGILKKKEEKDYSEKQLDNLLKSSVLMPDFYTLWNYRKDIISNYKLSTDSQKFYEFIQKELKLIMPVMIKNPKSYVLWFHRIWILKMAAEIENSINVLLENSLLSAEIGLCDNFLLKDERNFHCWNYRIKIFLMIQQYFPNQFNNFLHKELEITINLIKKNFSNFSAWHYRTKIIPFYFKFNKIDFQSTKALDYFKEDLEYIKNAIFTAPNDQSCWNFHYWIVNNLTPIYVEKIKFEDNTVSIKFSDIFKITSNICINLFSNNNLLDCYDAITEKPFSNTLQIIINQKNWDQLKIFCNLEKKETEQKLEIFSHDCFTKHSLYFPKICITKDENQKISVIFENDNNEISILCHEFLSSQLNIINDLIALEEKDKNFFFENARLRKAQLETLVLFVYYNPLSSHSINNTDNLIRSINDQYQRLINHSKRMKSMYEILHKNFNELINQ